MRRGADSVAEVALRLEQVLALAGGVALVRVRSPWLPQLAPLPEGVLHVQATPRLVRQVLGQMDVAIRREWRSGLDRLFDVARRPPQEAVCEVLVFDRCRVAGERCVIDGRSHSIRRGNWAFYVPGLGAKILHARNARRWCFHDTRPSEGLLAAGDGAMALGPYSLDDWRRALATPVLHRVAENYVSARRLAAIAAGPAVGRAVVIRELTYDDGAAPSPTAGFEVADLTRYLRKAPASAEDLARAGVSPDRIASALRQQIRGYVSDLDSVVGVLPREAAAEVDAVEVRLAQALSAGRA